MGNKKFKIEDNVVSANVNYSDLIQEEVELLDKEPRVAILNRFDEDLHHVPELLKETSPSLGKADEELKCKYCVYDGSFEHDGFDPVHKRGVWKKGKRKICTKKQSLESQNNKGVWFICDIDNMKKCHFFKPRK